MGEYRYTWSFIRWLWRRVVEGRREGESIHRISKLIPSNYWPMKWTLEYNGNINRSGVCVQVSRDETASENDNKCSAVRYNLEVAWEWGYAWGGKQPMYLESVSPGTQLATWKRSSTSPLDWLKLPHECDGSVLHLSFSILYIGQRWKVRSKAMGTKGLHTYIKCTCACTSDGSTSCSGAQ